MVENTSMALTCSLPALEEKWTIELSLFLLKKITPKAVFCLKL